MATKAGSGEAVQRAVLFADVCDSTAIYESLGDETALSLINTLFDKLGSITASHEGIVIKTLGDAVVCQFRDADKAFRAACDMQTAASMLGPRSPAKFAIKISFNYGPVVAEGRRRVRRHGQRLLAPEHPRQPRAGAHHAADRRRAHARAARALPAALSAQGEGQGRAGHRVRRALAPGPGHHRGDLPARPPASRSAWRC